MKKLKKQITQNPSVQVGAKIETGYQFNITVKEVLNSKLPEKEEKITKKSQDILENFCTLYFLNIYLKIT